MADGTPWSYRNLVIYKVFVRNHGPSGTFAEVEADIDRICDLGVDVIWLMPIHPIGEVRRKGFLGSPYSVRNYLAVNPEYGTAHDFERLISRIHDAGMKVMMDMVFNHCACDSDLVLSHIEWFHRASDGGPYIATEGWTDVVGFKHPHRAVSEWLIEVLKYWAAFGVDGFRCDVASLVSKHFWEEARREVGKRRADLLWLAESVSVSFIAFERAGGRPALADSELYTAFDATYDYDIWPIWQAAVVGKVPVSRYLEMLRFQDCIYPANYIKLRCVENHDSRRIMSLTPSRAQALAWIAFQAFNKGAYLIYAGQEAAATHTPSLFDRDEIAWGTYELQDFVKKVMRIKKDAALLNGQLVLLIAEPAIQATWRNGDQSLYGIFNVRGVAGELATRLPDGAYGDLLSGSEVVIRAGCVQTPEHSVIVRCNAEHFDLTPFYSDLIDFQCG